jgi:hypothetical protein
MSESAPAWFAEMVMPAVRLGDTSTSISPGREPDPLEIDPRPCGLCGLTIDCHEMVDDGEGPIFFCVDLALDEMTLPELERRARQVEVAEIMARIFAFAADDRAECPPPRQPEPYRPAASTIDAFWYVVSLRDPEHLRAWLRNRPQDAPFLIELLESK